MGIKLYQKRMNVSAEEADTIDWILCTQEDCYHGDTLGSKMVAEERTDRSHPWYTGKSMWLEAPTLGYRNGIITISFPEGMQPTHDVKVEFSSIASVMDVGARSMTKLLSLYKEFIEMQWLVYEHRFKQKIASVLIEPLLLCTGGMQFIDPLWQRGLIEVAESRNVPVILDESTVGLYRLGVQSCRSILNRDPDIAVYSKLLTGGLFSLSATLTSEEVFDAFANDKTHQSLLNGNTQVASPIACATALQALAAYDQGLKVAHDSNKIHSVPLWFDEMRCKKLSELTFVEQSFTLGTVLCVSIFEEDGVLPRHSRTERITVSLTKRGVKAHNNENTIYIMVTPLTDTDDCAQLSALLYETIRDIDS
jgi:bifunctional dethiobiotin synthetase / adenosylmethionine---8-amino-7-oxononanoate aminotransferase